MSIVGFRSRGSSGSSGSRGKGSGSSTINCIKEEEFKKNYPFPECKENFKEHYFGKYLERILNVNDEYYVEVKSYFLKDKPDNSLKDNPDNFIEITIHIKREDKEKIFFTTFVNNLKTMLINESNTDKHKDYTNTFIENLTEIGTSIFPKKRFSIFPYSIQTIFAYKTKIQFRFNYNHYTQKFTDGYSTLSFGLIDPENRYRYYEGIKNQVCNSNYSLANICVDGEYLKVLMNVFKKDTKKFYNKKLNGPALNEKYKEINEKQNIAQILYKNNK